MLALRLPAASLLGAAIAAAFFYLLVTLVQAPPVEAAATANPVRFERQIVDSQVEPKPRRPRKPSPPELRTAPGQFTALVAQRATPLTPPRIGAGTQRIGVELGSIGRFGGGGTDTETVPVFRPSPLYPPQAQMREIEGWVRVRFTVTERGSVADARVVAAEPAGVFERAALDAIAHWRYNPRIVDGTPIERVGVETILRFDLTE